MELTWSCQLFGDGCTARLTFTVEWTDSCNVSVCQTNEQLSFPAQHARWHTASRRLTGAGWPTGYTDRAPTDRPGLAGLVA